MKEMKSEYMIRRAQSSDDAEKLHDLFQEVFHPEKVGVLAKTMFHHLPRMGKENWFIAEEKKTQSVVSAFALIPWEWEMEGVRLKVAEMGIVGTQEPHRGKGLMGMLAREFDRTLLDEGWDLAVIQGIPGFYHKFGYHYSVEMENHINLHISAMPEREDDGNFDFRKAGPEDIPFLMEEDASYRKAHSLTARRDEANWNYLFTESLKTEYGSEFWIMNHRTADDKYYFRIPVNGGFGKGLILSEVSERISHEALTELFGFCRKKAREMGKPYVRINLHNDSPAGKVAIEMGAEKSMPYAWQIKFPDRAAFLKKIAPVMEKRIDRSRIRNYTGTVRLNFFNDSIDLVWKNGLILDIHTSGEGECDGMISMTPDLFPALCLSHRSWREIQYIRPDLFPDLQFVDPKVCPASGKSTHLMDALFPKRKSWIYCQY